MYASMYSLLANGLGLRGFAGASKIFGPTPQAQASILDRKPKLRISTLWIAMIAVAIRNVRSAISSAVQVV